MMEQDNLLTQIDETKTLNGLLLSTEELDDVIGAHFAQRSDLSYERYEQSNSRLDLYDSVEYDIQARMLLSDPRKAYVESTAHGGRCFSE